MTEQYYWACSRDGRPAGDRFLIANGQDNLWSRIRLEIDRNEICSWNSVHPGQGPVELSDIISLLLCQVPRYQIHHNKFLLEAGQIPVFAEFIYNHKNLACLVSNPSYEESLVRQQPYDEKIAHLLAQRVEQTLSIEFSDYL